METTSPTFSILITTKNRKVDLEFTLTKISYLLKREDVVCIICDDGSTDGTADFLEMNYPEIQLIKNTKSKGLIYSRNRLLDLVKTEFAISIDDDLHFITQNPLELIQKHFEEHEKCGLIALRIFWGLLEPKNTVTNQDYQVVQGFVGCAHVWRMTAWKTIPNYPEWFIFYGEEDFAAYQLFKANWQTHYLPQVLVNHRVNIKARKTDSDYLVRQRRSLRSGWYLMFMFYPIATIPKKLMYSVGMQLKLKVFKGDFKTLKVIILAFVDLIGNLPKILKNSNRFTNNEFIKYKQLPETKIYWIEEE